MDKGELALVGLTAYKQHDFPRAIEHLAPLIEADPQLWRCRLYLAEAYLETSQYDYALQEFHEITEACPDLAITSRAAIGIKSIALVGKAKAN
jgi:tetratricopeptide (TPR) repeat protein